MKNISEGCTVYGIPYGNAARDSALKTKDYVEGKITKLGRKYAYIDFPGYTAKWIIRDADRMVMRQPDKAETNDNNSSFMVFVSETECEKYLKAGTSIREVADYLHDISIETVINDLTPDGAIIVHDLINYLLTPDNNPDFLMALIAAAENLTAYTQALAMCLSMQKIIDREEAKAYLRYKSREEFPRAGEAVADALMVDDFARLYRKVRMEHDSDSDHAAPGEVWSKKECLDYTFKLCDSLKKYK